MRHGPILAHLVFANEKACGKYSKLFKTNEEILE